MNYRTFELQRDGQMLRGGIWGTGPIVVLGSHGITANHTTFKPLADRLGPGYTLIAVDHRGRGRSNGIRGPWGMQQHADDLIATLDHLQVQRAAVLVGQSMGGFVSAVAAAQHRERFGAVLFADGGLPLVDRLPWFLPVGLFLRLMLGPSMKRLDMTFPSREAYIEYWRKHPALAAAWSDDHVQYVSYDLVGDPPAMRSSTLKDAVIGDTRSMVESDLVPRSLQALDLPVRLLRAPRGIMDDKPLYKDAHVERWTPRIRHFSSVTIPDVNHYTLIMSRHGADAVTREIRALAERVE